VAFNILTQLVIVYAQQHSKKHVMMKEMLIVLTGLKPAYDAFKVSSNVEMEAHHIVDAQTEHSLTKLAELSFEAIPGCFLQAYALMTLWSTKNLEFSDSRSIGAVLSILLSTGTVGYASAVINYDLDTNPVKRKYKPEFYGYTPDNPFRRALIFLCMILNSSLLLLIRSISMASLVTVEPMYVIVYLLIDHSFHFLQKFLRGDVWYWMPVYGPTGLLATFIMRFFGKLVMDFTGMVQGRHPGELGGIYFTMNMVLAVVGSLVSMYVYLDQTSPEDLATTPAKAWTGMGCLCVLWFVSFCLFLMLMKKGYKHTFFSTQTGASFFRDSFLKGKDVQTRAQIVTINEHLWANIRADVKKWVGANWWQWEEDIPDWFTEGWKGNVPLDMIPKERREEIAKHGGLGRRGSSASTLTVFARASREDMRRKSARMHRHTRHSKERADNADESGGVEATKSMVTRQQSLLKRQQSAMHRHTTSDGMH